MKGDLCRLTNDIDSDQSSLTGLTVSLSIADISELYGLLYVIVSVVLLMIYVDQDKYALFNRVVFTQRG